MGRNSYRKGYFSTQVLGLLILFPIFGTSNPGLNSSIAPLTLEKVAQNEEEQLLLLLGQ